MTASIEPRPGLPGPTAIRGDDGSDPVHGREWDTGNDDLQYACTFQLPVPRDCLSSDPSCDCAGSKNPPLCGAAPGHQTRAKAYPTLRELRVAQGLGDRGVVGSICPTNGTTYDLTMNRVADRLARRLTK